MRRREFIGLVGGVAAWPLVARAQQPKKIIPTVGVLWHAASKEEEGILYTSMHEGFAALGYISGKNVVFEERFPGEIEGRFQRFANELVALTRQQAEDADYNLGPSRWVGEIKENTQERLPALIKQFVELSKEERGLNDKLISLLAPLMGDDSDVHVP